MGVEGDQYELEALLLQFSHGVRNELWARNMRMMIESYGWVSPTQVKLLVEEARREQPNAE
jgi:hypothetical protein